MFLKLKFIAAIVFLVKKKDEISNRAGIQQLFRETNHCECVWGVSLAASQMITMLFCICLFFVFKRKLMGFYVMLCSYSL